MVGIFCLVIFFNGFSPIDSITFLEPADGAETDYWRRIRTNSVPYEPNTAVPDSFGGLWVTAVSGSEYEPGVWWLPPGEENGRFRYITNDRRNNYVNPEYLTVLEKPELEGEVWFAVKDSGENVWYSLNNRKVLCEKPDGSWLTFDMQNTGDGGFVDTSTADSANRIRLIDRSGGGQEVLLISAKGVIHIDSNLNIVDSIAVYSNSNNDFINDVLIDSQNRYWIATNRGVAKGTSLTDTAYAHELYSNNPSVPGSDGEMPITCMEEDANGNLWFGSDNYVADGVYCFNGDNQWLKFDDGVVADVGKTIVSIASAPDGSVWFGALKSQAGGILRFIPDSGTGTWVRYRKEQLGTQSEAIISLSWADNGLWFVTGYEPSVPGNGTGVHFLTMDLQGQPQVEHYTFREDSTTLTSQRLNAVAADKKGSVWFGAYDDPSIARLKSDGTWEQFRGTAGGKSLGDFGIHGAAADSTNKIYFAPLNQPPAAYDASAEQWIDLTSPPGILADEFIMYYGVYVDKEDGKWFYGAFGACYLNPNNTSWVWYDSQNTEQFPDYRVDGVLLDDSGNVWFSTFYGLALMKKAAEGAEPVWKQFISGDDSGYLSGYRVYQDDRGGIWNSAKQKYDPDTDTWINLDDTSPFDKRHLRFLNGRIPADMDLSHALQPVKALDENLITIDSYGNIHFIGGNGIVNAGVVVAASPRGDVNRDFALDLADLMVVLQISAGIIPDTVSFAGDLNQDNRIGPEDAVLILRLLAGMD